MAAWRISSSPGRPTRRANSPRALPSVTSRDYGRPFAEIFKSFKGDFYKIDPILFSPAEAVVTAVESGETFRAGQISQDLLDVCFG